MSDPKAEAEKLARELGQEVIRVLVEAPYGGYRLVSTHGRQLGTEETVCLLRDALIPSLAPILEERERALSNCDGLEMRIVDIEAMNRKAIESLEARLREAEAKMPEGFYAERPLAARIEVLARIWNNAVVANKELEAERANICAALGLKPVDTAGAILKHVNVLTEQVATLTRERDEADRERSRWLARLSSPDRELAEREQEVRGLVGLVNEERAARQAAEEGATQREIAAAFGFHEGHSPHCPLTHEPSGAKIVCLYCRLVAAEERAGRLAEALLRLKNETRSCLSLAGGSMRAAAGHTNVGVLVLRINEAEAVLAEEPPAKPQPPCPRCGQQKVILGTAIVQRCPDPTCGTGFSVREEDL